MFKVLPVGTASNVGGWIGRNVGPRLATSRKAKRNLGRAMQGLSAEEQAQIIKGMWDNLGRVVSEYPHIEEIAEERVEIISTDLFDDIVENKKPAIFIGAHIGNWEVFAPLLLKKYGFDIDVTYRAPNNPWAHKLLDKARSLNGRIRTHPKSRSSGKALIDSLKQGRCLGILIDQKYNEGLAIPFFGEPAMTNPIFAKLCQKYKCPLIPVQGIRLEGTRFRAVVHDQIEAFDENGSPLSEEHVLEKANSVVESWVREHPDQWLWLHRRWDLKNI